MRSAPAIGFEYRPSRRLAALTLAVSALAMLAVALCAMPWWAKALLWLAIVGSWMYPRHYGVQPPSAVGWSAAAGWSLRLRDGRDLSASLQSWRIMGSCVLVRLVTAERVPLALWLLPDNSDADTRRRLRMRLLALPAEEPAEPAN